ncbi:MAG: hypothetical protein ACYTAF_15995, partial [Planctomycetota bacterium]
EAATHDRSVIVCFDARSGKELWRTKVVEGAVRLSAIRGGRAYWHTNEKRDGTVSFLGYCDIGTGKIQRGPRVPAMPIVWTDDALFTSGMKTEWSFAHPGRTLSRRARHGISCMFQMSI